MESDLDEQKKDANAVANVEPITGGLRGIAINDVANAIKDAQLGRVRALWLKLF